MKKRLFCLLLCLVMVLSLVPSAALAAEPVEQTAAEEAAVLPAEEAEALLPAETPADPAAAEEPGVIVRGGGWYLDTNYCLHLTGEIHYSYSDYNDTKPWNDYLGEIKSIVAEQGSSISSGYRLFEKLSALRTVDLRNLDTSQVQSMACMFARCYKLTSVQFGNINTSRVTNTELMFKNCYNLLSLDLDGLDLSKVDRVTFMFEDCYSLTYLYLGNLNPPEKYELGVEGMFDSCDSLTVIGADGNFFSNTYVRLMITSNAVYWKDIATGKVYYPSDLGHMKAGRYNLHRTDRDGVNQNAVILDANGGFFKYDDDSKKWRNGASKIVELTGRNSTLTLKSLPIPCRDNYVFTGWYTAPTGGTPVDENTEYTSDTFIYAQWKTYPYLYQDKHYNLIYYLDTDGCLHLTGKVVPEAFDDAPAEVKNAVKTVVAEPGSTAENYLSYFFHECQNLTSVDLQNFRVGNMYSLEALFRGCSSLTTIDFGNMKTYSTLYLQDMFLDCSSLTTLDLSKFAGVNAKRINRMFKNCSSLTKLDLSNFHINETVEAEEVLSGCVSLRELKATRSFIAATAEDLMEISDRWYNKETGEVYDSVADLNSFPRGAVVTLTRGYEITFDANGGSGSMPSLLVTPPPVSEYTLPTSCGFTAPDGASFDAAFSGKWKLVGSQLPNGGVFYAGQTVYIRDDVTISPVWKITDMYTEVSNLRLDDNGFIRLAPGKKLSDVAVTRVPDEFRAFQVYRTSWVENGRCADPAQDTLAPNYQYDLIVTVQPTCSGYEISPDSVLYLNIGGKTVKCSYDWAGSGLVDFKAEFKTACIHSYDSADWETDSGYHWHSCPICGTALDKAEHTWNSGTVNGNRTTYTCTACGETRTESNDNKQVGSLYIDLGTVVSGAAVPEVTSFRYPGDNGKASMTTVRFRKGTLNVNPGAIFEYRTTYVASTTITSKENYYFAEGTYPTTVYFRINGESVKATITFRSQNEIVASYNIQVKQAPTVEMRFPNGIHGGDDLIAKLAECAFVYNGTAQDLMVIASKDGELSASNIYMDGAWAYTDMDTLIAENFPDATPEEIAAYRALMTVQSGSTYGFILAPLSSMTIGRTIPEKLTITANGAVSVTPNEDGSFGAVAIYTAPYATVSHTVTFQMNGHGEAQTAQSIIDGANAKRPADPEAEGWIFGGWYADAACTRAFDFDAPITADTTIYAKWTVQPAPKTYTVSFRMNGHGSQIAPLTVREGEKIAMPAEPTAKGFTFEGWYANEAMTVRFDFRTEIHEDTVIYVKWAEKDICDGDPGVCPLTVFTDAPGYSNWAHAGIEYCVRHGLMSGTSATTFSPKTAMSRAMLVTVLYRMDGQPGAGSTTFTDVPAGQWYSAAVSWAADQGIVSGVGEGKFNPNGNVSREQIATILYRYAGYKGCDTTKQDDLTSFADGSKVGQWFVDGMKWAVAEGLISGTAMSGKTYLSPQGDATREQVAAILMRFCENVAK